FFFLTIHRQPLSTLFPTRRSSDLLVSQSTPKTFMCPSARFVPGVRKEQKDYAINGGPVGCCPERNNGTNTTLTGVANALIGIRLDRKSTRLNSSHVAISYAVFCLK